MTDLAAELDRLDAAREWEPWRPGPTDPWGLKWAGHLYRRAAFGGSWAELKAAVKAGPDATVELLFAGGPGQAEFDQIMDDYAPGTTNPRQPGNPNADPFGVDLEGWWLHRMILTPHPLREKLTLFWHNHFATSIAKVRLPALMRDQNLLLRRHALGQFGPLVQAVSKDPAMLVWLDSNSNVRGRPNENYARELMELFCLGVGNYTEADVREAARAFTGWHTNVTVEGNFNQSTKPAFVFHRSLHDDGEKTVLGKTGKWDGGDVVRIILDRPACARFIVRKLYRHFVSEAATPPDRLIEPLAERLRKSDYDIGAGLKVMLRSRHFFSAFALRQRVKGPVEYTVGLLRGLEAEMPQEAVGLSLPAATQELGQTLFAPPSVKGWDGGEAWLNTATVLARHNLAWRLLQGSGGPHAVRLNPARLVTRNAPSDPGKQTAFLLDLLVQPDAGEVDDRARAKLTAFLAEGKPRGAALDRRVREAAHAVATMPLFQLA
jgi:uncharacterized protein (DUF1800 family)